MSKESLDFHGWPPAKLNQPVSPARRRAIVAICVASFSCIAGCATFRTASELDDLSTDLESELKKAPGGNTDQLTAIARKIHTQSQTMIDRHQSFVQEFDKLASERGTSNDDLLRLSANYDADRSTNRDQLLLLQDKLHSVVPPELWPDIQELLNQKADLLSNQTALRI